MNPLDLKAALLEKHAQHVVIIHFPIALLITGVAFDLLAIWSRNRALAVGAYYDLLVVAVSDLPAVATGLLAWQWQYAGKTLRGNLRLHMLLGLASSALIWLVWWLHFKQHRKPEPSPRLCRLAIELAGVATVALTGHFAGILSGVNGAIG